MVYRKSAGQSQAWMAASVSIAAIGLLYQGVSAADGEIGSCAPCGLSETILLPCNSTLQMSGWPGTFTYQPTLAQAPCACNQNFYDQIKACLLCQSSDSAHLSVKPLPDYQLVCQAYGIATFPPVYIPGQKQTTAAPAPPDSTLPSNGSNAGSSSPSHSSLSSGAVAGIIVSAIALLVALSVAGYVFAKRKRELARQREEDELYKFQETNRNSYIEAPLPQYTGMIQSSSPQLPQLTNLRVMNPDSDDEDPLNGPRFPTGKGSAMEGTSFEVNRNSSPGWRRGSFDDD
ncbi:hypothetical protein BGZ68_004419 [Mortierella alpina]|nr:hypothetical protein BGZ68_004419 [Mortierella alpina]